MSKRIHQLGYQRFFRYPFEHFMNKPKKKNLSDDPPPLPPPITRGETVVTTRHTISFNVSFFRMLFLCAGFFLLGCLTNCSVTFTETATTHHEK